MYSSAAKLTSAFLNLQKFALNPAVVDRKTTFNIRLNGGPNGEEFIVQGLYLGSVETFNKTVWHRCFSTALSQD